MDDFRVGSISPYDSIDRHRAEAAADRRKRKHHDPESPEEDVVSLSEPAVEEEDSPGYGPRREQD